MIELVFVSIIYGFILLIWFKTNAFAEYMNLFGLSKFLKVSEYNDLIKNGYEGNFSDFLHDYYNSKFLVRLLSCPICLSFWFGIFSIPFYNFFTGFVLAPLTLFFYTLLNRML